MKFSDVISLAFQSIKNNKLRTTLTVAIITFGLTALIGILTSIEAMKIKLKDSFSFMGANSFTIRAKERKINIGGTTTTLEKKENSKTNLTIPPITIEEAITFKLGFNFPAIVSIAAYGQRNVTVKKGDISTNPNVLCLSGDENYIHVNGFGIANGRNLTNLF
jgi:putative ABC transport system permease protein